MGNANPLAVHKGRVTTTNPMRVAVRGLWRMLTLLLLQNRWPRGATLWTVDTQVVLSGGTSRNVRGV